MNMPQDLRLKQLNHWLTELDFIDYDIQAASEDASFRRYFRIQKDNKTWIAMDAPPDKEDCLPFVNIASMIENAQVQSPHIFHWNENQGFLLLSDLGCIAYLDVLNNDTADFLYHDAIDALIKMQNIEQALPEYNQTLLHTEMNLFNDWYLEKHLNLKLSKTQRIELKTAYDFLADQALQQTQTFVHRDYHSRNIMQTTNNNPGIIDFQDAVRGPITYDLASLLKDCYIAWPRDKILIWLDYYFENSPICKNIEKQDFIKHFDMMGVQRHLKAIGIFSRLNYRDNKPGYLHDIPRTLSYVFDVCQRYTELKPLFKLLSELAVNADPRILKTIQ